MRENARWSIERSRPFASDKDTQSGRCSSCINYHIAHGTIEIRNIEFLLDTYRTVYAIVGDSVTQKRYLISHNGDLKLKSPT